ncbi:MAG: hypothetical protein ACTHJU_12925 [Sphingopyxis sp.]
MKSSLTVMALAFCAASCSGPAEDQAEKAEGASAEIDAAGYEIAVRCQASFDAVARLYNVLAGQSSGSEQAEMVATAKQRAAAAEAYRGIARSVGAHIGHSSEAIDTAIKGAATAVDAEFQKRPFEDFATWVGQEADRCPPPAA